MGYFTIKDLNHVKSFGNNTDTGGLIISVFTCTIAAQSALLLSYKYPFLKLHSGAYSPNSCRLYILNRQLPSTIHLLPGTQHVKMRHEAFL